MSKHRVVYSPAALSDLDGIVSYIIDCFKDVKAAKSLSHLIRMKIRSLNEMPERYPLVEWEPWFSMKVHKIPVRNFVIYYTVDTDARLVTVIRIVYSGRNMQELIQNDH